MKVLNKKFKAFILAIILIIISSIVIILNGRTYVLKVDNINYNSNISDINELNIKIEDENIVKCIDKKLDNGIIKIKLESISQGKTVIQIKNLNNNMAVLKPIYVHNFGIITFDTYMGDSTGSTIIPISFTVWLLYILYLLIILYKQNIKANMYQYKNIAYLGIIIFIAFTIINQLFVFSNYKGLIETINEMLGVYSFTIFLLPIAFVLSILVILSNISLIRKEGLHLRNILGVVLGIFLCLTTILPDIMYRMLDSVTWIDIHNEKGIGVYLYNLVETIIYIVIAYIECVLIGTIIMGFKSARHIPKFNKDYIIILGCQIRKDGTLTNLLKGRVDRAIEFGKMQKEKTGKDIIFVPSGGKGNDEVISEAQAMKNYLLKQGVKEENILVEDKSKNTFENIKFSNNIIKEKAKNAKIAFSTTNYHVFRAGSIASKQNIYIEGIGSKTKSYFWINAFIREFIATIYSEKKKHIAVISSIIFIAIIIIAITYFNNSV